MNHTVFADPIEIENEKVILRPLQKEDSPAVGGLFDQPLSEDRAEELIAFLQAAHVRSKEAALGIFGKEDGVLKGIIEIYADDEECVRIGYRIRQPFRHQRYASEAVYLLSRYLCEARGVREIRALVKKDNEWSLRLLRHNGYEKTGEDQETETYVYFRKEKADARVFPIPEGRKMICAAGGCFWGTERIFQMLDGVCETECGYANGNTEDPRYEDVCERETGFKEAVMITYDPAVLSLRKILKAFFLCVDPTVANRQGEDIGSQYQTGIYYLEAEDLEIIAEVFAEEKRKHEVFRVELEELRNFYTAEEYHQNYLDKNPGGYCHISRARLEDVRKLNEEEL